MILEIKKENLFARNCFLFISVFNDVKSNNLNKNVQLTAYIPK